MSLSWPRSCSVAGRIETLLLLSCMRVSRSPRPKSIGPPQGRSGARRARMGNVDQVALEGMSFRGRHGVRPAEREQAQEFKVDIEVEADSVKLLETLAARIADRVLALPKVRGVTVRVAKRPVSMTPIESAAVHINRTRACPWPISTASQACPAK